MTAAREFEIQLVHDSEETCMGKFLLQAGRPDPRRCNLTLKSSVGTFESTDWNYFDALCQIREELEPLGWRPACYGACEDVYPSNMCRDMGQGMVAYRIEIGRAAEQEHLVETFGTDEDVVPSTVAQQRTFFKRWIASPR